MLTGQESADELLALWADLLRSRDGMASATSIGHIARYRTALEGQEREYFSQSEDFDIMNDLQSLFRKDVDCALGKVEAALRAHGVTVSRPPVTD